LIESGKKNFPGPGDKGIAKNWFGKLMNGSHSINDGETHFLFYKLFILNGANSSMRQFFSHRCRLKG
jgi:hypothetical protein